MSPRHKQSRSGGQRSLLLPVLLIALLGVVAVALSYLAVTGTSAREHGGLPERPAAIPTSVPEVTPTEAPPAPPLSQDLLALAGDVAMRSDGGSCAEPGSVEISLDGGREWGPEVSPAAAGATQILRLLPLGRTHLEVVALDEDCAPGLYRSVDRGATWTGPLPVEGTWFFNPADPETVGAPEGPQSLPCEGTGMSANGYHAIVTCRDGSPALSVDRGLRWSRPDTGEVLAAATAGDAFILAQAGDGTCRGIRLTTIDHVGTVLASDCHETGAPEGRIALANSGESTLLWVGDELTTLALGGAA
ncbi:hypothetical protein [Corynebacterium nasicanis]|uniref:Exo-alpha-sialidase n=1 Tax=Corynebacterium nasicanis TaxID=1448267 RepID=A0ABW1Q9U6_9CORY